MKMVSVLLVTLFTTMALADSSQLRQAVYADKTSSDDNYVFSNTSVDGLLSLLSYGFLAGEQADLAAYWGQSLDERSQSVLALATDSEEVTVSVSNQVWLDQNYSFVPTYVQTLESQFGITPQTMSVAFPEQVAASVNLVNGPFAYAVRDKVNGETLFEGVVTKP